MSEEARGRAFDALATEMASGTLSRGKAIKLMGAALVGGVLASLPGIAQAAPPTGSCDEGFKICAKFLCCDLAAQEVCCKFRNAIGVHVVTCATREQCKQLRAG